MQYHIVVTIYNLVPTPSCPYLNEKVQIFKKIRYVSNLCIRQGSLPQQKVSQNKPFLMSRRGKLCRVTAVPYNYLSFIRWKVAKYQIATGAAQLPD